MPWLSIIMFLVSFFTTKKKTNGNTAAALAAGALAGAGTYYVTHETEWGKENLGFLDGVITTPDPGTSGPSVTVPADTSGGTKVPTVNAGTGGFWGGMTDVLKDWGPTGVAGVIGTTGLVASGNSKWLVYGGIALIAIMLLK